jgi:hypothetical protein
MKHLISYNSKSEYYKDYYDGKLSFPHVCRLPDEVIYAEKFEPETDDRIPLYIEALEDLTVSFSVNAIQYSLDNSTWVDLPANTETPTVSAGNKIYFRADKPTAASGTGSGTFTINGQCNVGGNAMSMRLGKDFLDEEKNTSIANYAFQAMFKGQLGIISATRLILPAQRLGTSSYASMFYGCANLKTPPKLPAIELQESCYQSMFYNCSSLEIAPDLPARQTENYAYSYMFYGCINLVKAPKINISFGWYSSNSYYYANSNVFQYMFYGCTRLVDASDIYICSEYLGSYCFQYMFYNCTNLTLVPRVVAKYTNTGSFQYMFYNCSSLETCLELKDINTNHQNCCSYMYANCTRLKVVPKKLTGAGSYSYSYMFYNCTSITESPNLSSTSFASSCYDYMFYGCVSLSKIKMMVNSDSWNSDYTTEWVANVAPKGVFIKNSAATYIENRGTSYIPSRWTVETASE